MPGGYGKIKPSDNPKPYKKGEVHSPNGRPPKLPDLGILLGKVLGEEKDSKTAVEIILMALRAKATKGDIRAAELLLERAYGKVKQEIDQKIEIEEQVFRIGDQVIKFK
jgi:hypothetical protein